MRKNAKSILLTVVSAVGLVCIMTGFSFAANYTDIDNNPHGDAILEMSRLGILEGVGNSQFAPEAELNRAAAAKVAAFLLGYNETDAAAAAQADPMFTDIEGTNHAWALGWINLMAEDSILLGVGNNQYAPGAPLQMVHWVTILTRVLQHEQPGMAWPDDYNSMSNSLGLDRGLYYEGSSVMSRAEMARMTSTALYMVERADGKRIFDLVDFAEPPLDEWFVSEQEEPLVYSNADFDLKLEQALVKTGGNQTVTITATATYGAGRLPAAHTRIGFFANVGANDRRGQLSAQSAITDADGIARVTYTTLAADDNKPIEFKANIQTDDEWIDRTISALASDTAAFIDGRVINPFNGEIPSEVKVGIATDNSYDPIPVNQQGYYSAPINAGTYYVNIELNATGTVPYSGEYRGSHFSINNNGDMRIMIQRSFVSGNSYTIASEMGIITGTSSLTPGTDIYITLIGTNNTVIATIGANGRFLIALAPGCYEITNRYGTSLKANITIQKGIVADIGAT
jgi:hypothetical protein